jgi:hypothetical protein
MPRAQRPDSYRGPEVNTLARIIRARAPTSADYRRPETNTYYEIGTIWIDSTNLDPWILIDISANSATWEEFGLSASALATLTGDDSVVVGPDAANNIDILGVAVANATNAQPLYVDGDATLTKLDLELQVATEVTGAPGDKNDAGICSFDDTSFAVDADGYVTLAGGSGPSVDSITGDDADAVGADANGNIDWQGSTVANATNAKPLYMNGTSGSNLMEPEIQVSTEITGAPADANDAGICSFNDTQFTVDAEGYVELVGGSDKPTVQGIIGDEGSGNVPDASGDITITGDAVANATHAKPVYVDDTAASASTIDVQVGADRTGAPGDKNDAGICSFDDTQFTVDDDGYVILAGLNSTLLRQHGNNCFFSNLSFTHAAGTLTLAGGDGTALSATNPGYVIMGSNATAGRLVIHEITANDTLTVSDLTNNIFGTTAAVAWGNDLPMYVGFMADSSDANLEPVLCRLPNLDQSPAASADIGDPSAAAADKELSVFAWNDITEADYQDKSIGMIGSLRATKDGGDAWTLVAMDVLDGAGKWQENRVFSLPLGQNGAAAGKHMADNGGTAAQFTDVAGYQYTIRKNGTVQVRWSSKACTVAGVGAVEALVSLPYSKNVQYRPTGSLEFIDDSGSKSYIGNCDEEEIGADTLVEIIIGTSASTAMPNTSIDLNDSITMHLIYTISQTHVT